MRKLASNLQFAEDGYKKMLAMQRKAKDFISANNAKCETAFRTEGYQGADCVCILPSSPEGEQYEGYIVYDLDTDSPVLVREPKD